MFIRKINYNINKFLKFAAIGILIMRSFYSLILFEMIILHLSWSEPIRFRQFPMERNQKMFRSFKFDLTNETLMTEREFFKIFNSCLKECLKLKRAIQRDKCLASVCDIY